MVSAPRKRIKVTDEAKAARLREDRKRTASNGVSTAIQKGNDAKKRHQAKLVLRADLESRAKEGKNKEEAEELQRQLEKLDQDIQGIDTEMKEAQDEEAKFKQQEEDADKGDVYEDDVTMSGNDGNNENGVEGSNPTGKEGFNPDKPLPSFALDLSDLVQRFQKGLSLDILPSGLDITKDVLLRHTQRVLCWKPGFGKPAIVIDAEIPEMPIYRIRTDITYSRKECPNLMKWRRAGKVKNEATEKTWSVDDIKRVLGIAIEVPKGYPENPENLVRLIPELSATEKEALIKQKLPIPRQPDVQLVLEWKEGLEVNGVLTHISLESRSGCRTLWKKASAADEYLLASAIHQEQNYRRLGGMHSSEKRSMPAPPVMPRAGSTPPPGNTPDPGRTPTPENTPTPTPQTTPEPDPKPTGKDNAANDEAEAEAEAKYLRKWCGKRGLDPKQKLTPTNQGIFDATFESYWKTINNPS